MKTFEEHIIEIRQHLFFQWLEGKITKKEFFERMEQTRKERE
jgi:hypothetical protein